jgi:hypothetical protein
MSYFTHLIDRWLHESCLLKRGDDLSGIVVSSCTSVRAKPWSGWRQALMLEQPERVVGWHRASTDHTLH